jgi:hypothetical protein
MMTDKLSPAAFEIRPLLMESYYLLEKATDKLKAPKTIAIPCSEISQAQTILEQDTQERARLAKAIDNLQEAILELTMADDEVDWDDPSTIAQEAAA